MRRLLLVVALGLVGCGADGVDIPDEPDPMPAEGPEALSPAGSEQP